MKPTSPLLAAFAGLLLSACSTQQKLYDGPELDPKQASWLNLNQYGPPLSARRVDGKSITVGSHQQIELLPGRHTLVYELTWYHKEDVEAEKAAVKQMTSDKREVRTEMRYVVYRHELTIDAKPGWAYGVRVKPQPADTASRPDHCLIAAPAVFEAGKREPSRNFDDSAAVLMCAPAVSTYEGVTTHTVTNPNYVDPYKKQDKDKKK